MAFYLGYLNPFTKIVPSPQREVVATDDQLREDSPTPTHSNDRRAMSREESPEIANLVQTMNEDAGKSPKHTGSNRKGKATLPRDNKNDSTELRRSPRKRDTSQKPESGAGDIKRRRITEPHSVSSGLKRKSSGPKRRPSAHRGDVFEISDEDRDAAADEDAREAENEEDEPARMQSSPAPAKKQTNRKQIQLRKKASNLSPLKDHGTIELPATGEVNLADSPSKRPAGRPRKPELKASRAGVNQGVPEVIMKPTLRPGSSGRAASDPRRKGPAGKAREKENHDQRSDNAVGSDALIEGVVANTAAPGKGKTREELRKEREEKRVKDRATELKDIETISNMHGWGCSLAWGDLFAAITELIEMRNSAEPESQRGTRLCRRIHRLTDRYRTANTEPEDAEELPSITDAIQRLADSIWRYPENRKSAPSERAKKCRDLYGHVVPNLVRLLQRVMKIRQVDGEFDEEVYDEMCALLEASWNAADRACKWEPRPSQLENGARRLMRDDVRKNLGFLKEKYLAHRNDVVGTAEEQRLDAFAKVQQRAQEHLEAVNRQRRADIQAKYRRRVPVNEAIVISERERLEEEQDDQEEGGDPVANGFVQTQNTEPIVETHPSETEVLDNFHALQKRNQEARDKARKEMFDAVRNKNRNRLRTTGVVAATEPAILDIDDIPSLVNSQSDTTPTPPNGNRAQTEEIPGPVQPAWTEIETRVFMNLLQIFTGRSRFEQILAHYGGPGKHLERHDRDSLISQAMFLKECHSLKIQEEPENFGWLTSVS